MQQYKKKVTFSCVGNFLLVHSFNIQLNQFHCYVVIRRLIKGIPETHSQFQVISSCLVEGFGEIWRIVETTTCTVGVTVSPIPESVIGVESVQISAVTISRIYVSRLTEIIFTNKWWDGYNTSSITWTVVGIVSCIILPSSISKCPDVLLRTAIHYSHTTDIGTVNCSFSTTMIPLEGIWCPILVGSDPTTHLTVWSSTDWEED